jgi:MFS family permease
MVERVGALPALRAFRYRDFRLLWAGSFFSFTGSWVQSVAQGWLVYDLTRDEAKLAFVTFCSMAPVSLFGIFAGTLADTLNRKAALVAAQGIYAACAGYLAFATHFGFVTYEQIVVIALLLGLVSCVEMPTRQSVVGRVVPVQDLSAAVPINAMTFNLARVIGPAIGGILLARVGPEACYMVNALSYSALIFAVLAIRSNLAVAARESTPIRDLLFEGLRYTWRDVRLRTLFWMEALTSAAGLFYLALLPAIAREMLGLDQKGLGLSYTFVGVGALAGLLLLLALEARPFKAGIVRLAMAGMGFSLLGLALAPPLPVAMLCLAVAGGCSIAQFNTTNTLFQLLSPDRLRGRVIAMHIWAISGVGPFGTLFFGWLARQTSVPYALQLGGSLVLLGALLGLLNRGALASVHEGMTDQGSR